MMYSGLSKIEICLTMVLCLSQVDTVKHEERKHLSLEAIWKWGKLTTVPPALYMLCTCIILSVFFISIRVDHMATSIARDSSSEA